MASPYDLGRKENFRGETCFKVKIGKFYFNLDLIVNLSVILPICVYLSGRRTDIELLQVQLGEETDSKLLLGTYKCTDVPGEFIWESGILTKVRRSLVLEYILQIMPQKQF